MSSPDNLNGYADIILKTLLHNSDDDFDGQGHYGAQGSSTNPGINRAAHPPTFFYTTYHLS